MREQKALILICLLAGIAIAQDICREQDAHLLNYLKKGMTYQV